jgi:hypothetical protein
MVNVPYTGYLTVVNARNYKLPELRFRALLPEGKK